MLDSDVVDELHNQHCLTHPCAAKEANLASAKKRFEEVNDLDSGHEHFEFGRLVLKLRGVTVNRVTLFGRDRTQFIHRLADHVQNSSQSRWSYRYGNRSFEIYGFHSSDQTFRWLHSDASAPPFTE